MVSIIIIAHAGIGDSLITAATHMFGEAPENCIAIPIDGHDNLERLLPRIKTSIRTLNKGEGVLILSDMIGGTPSNIIKPLLVANTIEAIAGVNLPMLIRTLNYRSLPMHELVAKAISGGQQGVLNLSAQDD